MYSDEALPDTAVSTDLHEIREIRSLTDKTFVLRFDRGNMQFRAGQHIIVGLEGELDQREYSVYSGENDDYLEILVREVVNGNISLKLGKLQPGQMVQVNGPFGAFGIEPFDRYSGKLIFIGSGTGISPFHSFVRSYPGMDYTLIHGVRYRNEAYEKDDYDPLKYILCTSKEVSDGRKGRVTRFLPGFRVNPEMRFYLCGNGSMIYEAYHILRDKGVADDNIIKELYF
jgi:ferredoxin/flavodoxin---NADP+ reductase